MTNTTTAPDPVQLIALAGSERPGTLRDVLTIYGRRIERTGMFALLAPGGRRSGGLDQAVRRRWR